jgi:hypothetical protein
LDFTLRAWRIGDPEYFITYENTPDIISEDKRRKVQLGLEDAQTGAKQGQLSEDKGAFPSSE